MILILRDLSRGDCDPNHASAEGLLNIDAGLKGECCRNVKNNVETV
jgi:hypothetical protein